MHKILVTGSAGLIESAVTSRLRSSGCEVVNRDIRFIDNPLSVFSDSIQAIIEECDHLAAISRVMHRQQYPALCHQVNIEGSKKFLKFYKHLSHKLWLIYGSSREVYGEQELLPVSEDTQYNPVNKYAEGKVAIENIVNNLGVSGFNTIILRFSNVYGGLLDHRDRVIPAFCLNALRNESIQIDGKECIFDFIYIEDVVNEILLLVDYMIHSQKIDSAIHFTSCRGCNLEKLANIVLEISGSNPLIEYTPPRNFSVSRSMVILVMHRNSYAGCRNIL